MKRGKNFKFKYLTGTLFALIWITFIVILIMPQDKIISPTLSPASSYNPLYPIDCSSTNINQLWTQIFKSQTFTEGQTYTDDDINEKTGTCDQFLIYKTDDQGITYILSGKDSSYRYNLPNSVEEINDTYIEAMRVNITSYYITLINSYASQSIHSEYYHPWEALSIVSVGLGDRDPPLVPNDLASAHVYFFTYFNTIPELSSSDWTYQTTEYYTINSFNYVDESSQVLTEKEIYKGLSLETMQNQMGDILTYNQEIIDSSLVRIPGDCTPDWEFFDSCWGNNDKKTRTYIDHQYCDGNNYTYEINTSIDCDSDRNGFIGNVNEVHEENTNTKLKISTSGSVIIYDNITSSVYYYQRQNVSFVDENNEDLVAFEWDFGNDPLYLRNITIKKESSTANEGYIIVNGIDTTKTFYIDRLDTNSSGVCIKNAHINSISEISDGCSNSNEVYLSCPGSNLTFSCIIQNNNFQVSGLSNSAVLEFSPNDQGGCISQWQEGPWSLCENGNQTRTSIDLNACAPPRDESQLCTPYIATIVCQTNWTCSEFSPTLCPKNTTQYRTCIDTNSCGNLTNKPEETGICEYKSDKSWIYITIIIAFTALILIIIIIIIVLLNKTKEVKEEKFYY
ncbi:hypothetical protein COU57_06435 [Candidatus Pacearchaeota archaeon CG10_big_fil_rev_8_21_14_0_10_32_14]|nr:MAG: hypothetical protein COU57_06435 [Candidatus Pacearchaeota archaeon CG10_big_fil_rev_8_21_14_0_10_32_14]